MWNLICGAGCPAVPPYTCYPPAEMPVCSSGNIGDIFYFACQEDRPSTSATSSTTTTTNSCLGNLCTWVCQTNGMGSFTYFLVNPCTNPFCGCDGPDTPGVDCVNGTTEFTVCYMP
jgi:hypothetical protein